MIKTLNLINKDTSPIKYQHFKYPDSQQQIIINNYSLFEATEIHIITRLSSFADVEMLVCAVKSIRRIVPNISLGLEILYLLGSRSDRTFYNDCVNADNHYLRDVICPIINNLNFSWVEVLEPHSNITEACLYGYRQGALLAKRNLFIKSSHRLFGNVVLLFPDLGAQNRYKDYLVGSKHVCCSKKREKDKVTVDIPMYELSDKNVFIIDDLCDGGATFIDISLQIKRTVYSSGPKTLNLVVTHGIFSKGVDYVANYFDKIYVTNSFKEYEEHPKLDVYDVTK